MAAKTAVEPMKIFLSHSTDAPSIIRDVLIDSGIEVESWDSITTGPLQQQLVRAISSCDALAVEVDDPTRLSAGVFVEVGIALGTRTPVLLLIPDGRRGTDLPSTLAEFPVIWTGGPDREAIARRTSDTVKTAQRVQHATTSRPANDASSPDATPREYADASERRVGQALEELSARVVRHGTGNERSQVDLTIWLDDLEPMLNPVLVEVTGRLPHVKSSLDRLRRYAADRDARLAMLVTPDDRLPEWTIEHSVAMVTIGVEQLEAMEPDELPKLLRTGRNLLFHAR